MATIKGGPWLPDQPDYDNGGVIEARGCVPRTVSSYGPMPAPAATSSALGDRCQGAVATTDQAGNVVAFAGDAKRLYRLTGAATVWADVSKAGGYTVAETETWRFAPFGDRVIAVTAGTAPQVAPLNGDAFADLAADAPQARFVAVVRDWLVLANTVDAADGPCPQRVWWSGVDDPTSWPVPGTTAAAQVQSDRQDLPGDHGAIQGLVAKVGALDAAVFCERAVFRMSYAGYPLAFSFAPCEGARGTPAPGSLVQMGSLVFYLAHDGFYAFDGMLSRPIGAGKVDHTILSDLDAAYLHRVSGAADPVNRLVAWAYPGRGHTGGRPNRLALYNWALDRWSLIDGVDCELVLRSLSAGLSLDGLDAVGASLDTLTIPLDSRSWCGGAPNFACFDASHRLALFAGPALAATVVTGEGEWGRGRRMIVTGARPLVDGGTPSVAIGTRERLTDPVVWGRDVAINAVGVSPQRANGLYLRARINVPAGANWKHIQGVDILGTPAGGLR